MSTIDEKEKKRQLREKKFMACSYKMKILDDI